MRVEFLNVGGIEFSWFPYMTDNEAKTLRWIEGFAELSALEIRRISLQCRWRWYKPHDRILSQEDSTNDVFFVVQGKIRIVTYSEAGKEISFRDLGAGRIFGELAAIDGLPRSASAVALSDALLASMPAKLYLQTLQGSPALSMACLKRLSQLVRALSERVVEFATMPVRDRILAELARMAVRRPTTPAIWVIDPMPTHSEIANRVATHREAVTRVLRKLADDGVVSRRGRALIVSDIRRLSPQARQDKMLD